VVLSFSLQTDLPFQIDNVDFYQSKARATAQAAALAPAI